MVNENNSTESEDSTYPPELSIEDNSSRENHHTKLKKQKKRHKPESWERNELNRTGNIQLKIINSSNNNQDEDDIDILEII